MIFCLNSPATGGRIGLEPSQTCSESSTISSEIVSQTLRRLTKSLVQKRGIEKNLFIKKFIKNIIYSSSQIQITLYFSKDSENLDFSFFGGGKQKNREKIRSEFSPVKPDLLVRDNKIGSSDWTRTSNPLVTVTSKFP